MTIIFVNEHGDPTPILTRRGESAPCIGHTVTVQAGHFVVRSVNWRFDEDQAWCLLRRLS